MSGRVGEDPELRESLDRLQAHPGDTAALERLASILGERAADTASSGPGVQLLLDSARIHHDDGDDRSAGLALALARRLAGNTPDALLDVAETASGLGCSNEVVEVLQTLRRAGGGDSSAISAAAAYLIDTDQVGEAIATFRGIVERDPHKVETWVDLVAALDVAHRPGEALRATEHALAANPENPMLLAQQAGVLYILGEEPQAAERAETAVADPTLDADFAALALEVLRLTGHRDRVRELLGRYLETSPEAARLLIAMGNLLTETGDYDGAIEQYRRAGRDPLLAEMADVAAAQAFRRSGRLSEAAALLDGRADSRDADTLLERASLAMARGDPAETERVLTPVVDQDPSNDEALRLLSAALRFRHDFAACARLLDREFIGRAARVAAAERGYLALDRGLYKEAEAAFRGLLGDRVDPVEAVEGLADALRAQGKLAAARELVQRALQEHPGDVLLRQDLGLVAYDERRYDEAAAVFGDLVEQDPYDPVSRRWQASSLRLAKRSAEARRVLDDAPTGQDDPNLALERGWLAYDESGFGAAEGTFRRLLGQRTDPIEAVWGLSAVLRAQGRPAEAAKLVERALRDHPADPSLQRELGWVAYDQRRYEDAVTIFGDLVRENPLSILDRRWLAVSLRMAKRYPEAQKVLQAAPQHDDPSLDLERGWLAYDQSAYELAARHFQAAEQHGATTVEYVPPLVSALLRSGDLDAAEQATAIDAAAPTLMVAQSEVLMERGRPQEAIEVLMRPGQGLDEAALLRLVSLLLVSNRDDDARDVFDRWLASRASGQEPSSRGGSPDLIAVQMELAGRNQQLPVDARIRKIEETLERYSGDDPVPAVIAAKAIKTLRILDLQRSSRLARQSVASHQADVDVLMEAAETQFTRHDYDAALAGFERVLQLDDRHDRATQWRCRALRRLGRWDELDDYLAARMRKLPRSAGLCVELGWLRNSRSEHRAALQAFTDALRADCNYGQALLGRVNTLRELQRWNDAERVLEDWKARWPGSRRRQLAEAMLRFDRERFELADELFRARRDLPGALGKAAVLVRTGKEPEARRALEQAIRDYPDRPGPKVALGSLLCKSSSDRELDRAEALYHESMGFGAEIDANALAGRAHVELSRGHLRAAESLFEEAMERHPYGPYAVGMAEALRGEHRAEAAVELLEKWVRTNPGHGASYCQLYLAHTALGHRDQAVDTLRSALAANPDDDGVAVALAYALEEIDRSADAEQLLRSRLGGRRRSENRLRLGLAWILLARGDRTNTSAPFEDAARQASLILANPDPTSPGVDPARISNEAMSCRGTAYYKLAERERNPGERLRLAALARKDQQQGRLGWLRKSFDFGLDAVLRLLVFLGAVALLAVLWVLHGHDDTAWTTTMVVSLTPLLLAAALLAALLPSLQMLRLAGLEAQTRERPADVLPTSAPVTLPQVTDFAAAAYENLLDVVNVDELYSVTTSPRPTSETASVRSASAAPTPTRTSPAVSGPPTR